VNNAIRNTITTAALVATSISFAGAVRAEQPGFAVPSDGPPGFNVSIDESGNPAIIDGKPDPGIPTPSGAPIHFLGRLVFSGDVLIEDPNSLDLSDILRFLPLQRGSNLSDSFQFLSDESVPADDPGDVGTGNVNDLQANQVVIHEPNSLPEDMVYKAGDATYQVQSDAGTIVPGPESLPILGLGIAPFFLCLRTRFRS
jgi:hypothetical protein